MNYVFSLNISTLNENFERDVQSELQKDVTYSIWKNLYAIWNFWILR